MVKKLSKGFREFLIKSSVFVVLFVLIQLITMGIVAKTSLPGDLKLFAMDDLAESLLFALIIFIGLNPVNLKKHVMAEDNLKTIADVLIKKINPNVQIDEPEEGKPEVGKPEVGKPKEETKSEDKEPIIEDKKEEEPKVGKKKTKEKPVEETKQEDKKPNLDDISKMFGV